MQNKKWKYVSLVLLTTSILLLSYSVLSQNSNFNTYLSDNPANFEFTYHKNNNIKSVSYLTDTGTYDIDQSQEEATGGIMIGNMIVCQGVENDYPPMLAFSVCIEEKDSTGNSEPLYIGLISSKLVGDELYNTNNWDAVYSLDSGLLPADTAVWFTCVLQNPVDYESGEKFYIILASNDHISSDGYFIWKYSDNAPYSNGKTWTYNTMMQTHHDYLSGWNEDVFSQAEIDSCYSDHPEDVFGSIDYDCILNYVFEDGTWDSFWFCTPGGDGNSPGDGGGTLQHILPDTTYHIQVSQDIILFFNLPNNDATWQGHSNWDTCFVTWTDFPNEDTEEEAGTWNLNEGWNEIVFTQGNLNAVGSIDIEDVFSSIDHDCILNYVFEDGTWDSFWFCDETQPGGSRGGTLQEIKPGITYHVQVSQDCILTISTGGGGEPPEPEEPSISISLTAQVIQATGILSLIGAVISGAKHLIIMGVI